MTETDFKISSAFILRSLFRRFDKSKFHIFESFVFSEESDFLVIGNNDYSHEIEVKISRGDFKNDFKKHKHSKFAALREKREVITVKGVEQNATCSIDHLLKRHEREKRYGTRGVYNSKERERVWQCPVWFQKISKRSIPNKFSFACPEGMIKLEEIPDYYGLYYINKKGKATQVRAPKFIHKDKFDRWKDLASKYYWKWRNRSTQLYKVTL